MRGVREAGGVLARDSAGSELVLSGNQSLELVSTRLFCSRSSWIIETRDQEVNGGMA